MDIPLKIAKRKIPTYGPTHVPAMKVPHGGSSCSKCSWYSKEGGKFGVCNNAHYSEYYGTKNIPVAPDDYCSDWFEPSEGSLE